MGRGTPGKKGKVARKKLKTSNSFAASLMRMAKNTKATEEFEVEKIHANEVGKMIERLVAPPTYPNAEKRDGPPPCPKRRKPQRGYHESVCTGCGEGTEYDILIYCANCPVAFHPTCDDRPSSVEDIGCDWKCKSCRFLDPDKKDDMLPSKWTGDADGDGMISKFFRQSIAAQEMQNPTELKLPTDLPAYRYPFPGTSRYDVKGSRSKTGVIEVKRNGQIPKPVVYCFNCHKSCLRAPLLQCDKCDMAFHLDCLNPPLATIPNSIWVCPLHMEPYLESTQLTTCALSERVKIWEQGQKPVKRTKVMQDFLQKRYKKNSCTRDNKQPIRLNFQREPEVPVMVQDIYRTLAMSKLTYAQEQFGNMQTLAAACEVEGLKMAREKLNMKSGYRNPIIEHYLPLGNSLVKHKDQLDALKSENQRGVDKLQHISLVLEYLQERRTYNSSESTGTKQSTEQRIMLEQMFENFPIVVGSTNVTQTEEMINEGGKTPILSVVNVAPVHVGELLLVDEEAEMKQENFDDFDEEDLKTENWMLNEVHAAKNDIANYLIALNNLSREVKRIGTLLYNRPLSEDDLRVITSKISFSENLFPSSLMSPESNEKTRNEPVPSSSKSTPKKDPDDKCIARNSARKHQESIKRRSKTYVPPIFRDKPKPIISFYIENLAMNVEITRRSFWVGSGEQADLKITDFVKCNRIDAKHARVFYNDHEQCWEILNYSSNGLYVNDTLFGCKSDLACVSTTESANPRSHELHEKTPNKDIRNHKELHDIGMNGCFCQPFPTKSPPIVLECSAKLLPGHKLQIGCVKLSINTYLMKLP